MATKAEQEKILQLSVDEVRRKYDELTRDFDQLRVKVLAFISGELALIALLFASGLPVPRIVYGIFFFLFGIGCITASFIILLFLLRSILWSSPIHPTALERHDYSKFPTKADFLEFICKCYSVSLEKNSPKLSERAKLFDNALMLLFIGAIIFLVIKYGQGVVLWRNLIQL